VSNPAGNFQHAPGPHTNKGDSSTFGKPKGAVKPDTQNFSKKGTGKMGATY